MFVDVEAVRGTGELEDAYTRIDSAGQLDKVVKALRRSMGGLVDLRILKVGSDFLLHTFFDDRPPVPAYLAGDGFKRFLALAAAAVATPKGVVLLEEPEAFQHPRYLRELATLLLLAAHDGTQIILSTHSLELIDLLLLAPEAEGQTYPAVHRLNLHEGKLRATSLPREDAVLARESLLEDLRT
jgi:predicted ATPase